MKSIGFITAALAIAAWLACVNQVMATEKATTDPTGTWKITTFNPETRARGAEQTLKLKLEGGKLTGSITTRSSVNGNVRIYEWSIADGQLQGSNISFKVSHPPNVGKGPNSNSKYQGKLSGDTMQGKVEIEWSGNTFTKDWEAKRAKD